MESIDSLSEEQLSETQVTLSNASLEDTFINHCTPIIQNTLTKSNEKLDIPAN